MRSAFVVLLLAAALGLAVWRLIPGGSGEPRRSFVPAWTGGRLVKAPGMTILRLAGTPREKGLAHGRQLAERIRARYARLDPAPLYVETLGPRAARALPAALREEIEGIAEGCGLSFEQVWYLNLRFDLAAFEADRFTGDAAVSAAGEVLRRFEPSDLEETPRELCVFVHLDERPLALVGLPGMAGCFLGAGGAGVGALRPVRNAPDPALTGLAWTLLLRLLLDQQGEPALPAPATLDASVVLTRDRAGTFDLSPRGAAWHPVDDAFVRARSEPVSEEPVVEAQHVEQARSLFLSPPPARLITVRLAGLDGGLRVTIHRDGVQFAQVIRFAD